MALFENRINSAMNSFRSVVNGPAVQNFINSKSNIIQSLRNKQQNYLHLKEQQARLEQQRREQLQREEAERRRVEELNRKAQEAQRAADALKQQIGNLSGGYLWQGNGNIGNLSANPNLVSSNGIVFQRVSAYNGVPVNNKTLIVAGNVTLGNTCLPGWTIKISGNVTITGNVTCDSLEVG
eukprot:TRINITY_DN4881_c0_g1_i1.p1 TRINITY_DN4881_c0_g1~~TRINITY_DN4881_c0_g1_i1.p1  ORF type:complete len:181 (-),score=24.45 TRINITY_DN4881_c0_g1_i1:94-636(-)